MGVTRFLLDTNMAGHYINRRQGVFDRARVEVANGNPIGIGVPVLAELVAGIEHSSSRWSTPRCGSSWNWPSRYRTGWSVRCTEKA